MSNKYLALIRRNIGAILEYRASTLIWILSSVTPLVMLAVWSSLAESGPVAGYSQADFASYFLLLALVRQMTNVWVAWELDAEIRYGGLATKLLHPLNPLHEYVAENLADKVVRAIFLAPFILLALALFPMIHYDLTAQNILLTIAAVVAAWVMLFFSQCVFGLLSFWVSSAMTLHEVWYAFAMLFGGMLAPLDLFPPQVAQVARGLPFRYMLSFPVEILLGRVTPEDLLAGYVVSAFWIVVFVVLYRGLWHLGLKQFGAFGA
ncbi:MAG: ABC-2 family transporter protein [Chloroflexi bacterium]|nr:ABC-2 family transporter protein [Chloroflexota bacterium]